jgi:hypothetical protein
MEQNNPLANQSKPDTQSPQVQAAPGGNPLAQIAPALQMQQQPNAMQQPAPTAAQTTAAVHRFGAIQSAMRSVMEDKVFGTGNIRPKLLDAASKLLGTKILSLPEVMNSIKDIPDDPIQQKAFVQNLFNSAKQAEANVLDHYGAAIKAGLISADDENGYAEDSHGQHIDGLMKHYKRD